MDWFMILEYGSISLAVISALCAWVEVKSSGDYRHERIFWSWVTAGGLCMWRMFVSAGKGNVVSTVAFGVVMFVCIIVGVVCYWKYCGFSESEQIGYTMVRNRKQSGIFEEVIKQYEF